MSRLVSCRVAALDAQEHLPVTVLLLGMTLCVLDSRGCAFQSAPAASRRKRSYECADSDEDSYSSRKVCGWHELPLLACQCEGSPVLACEADRGCLLLLAREADRGRLCLHVRRTGAACACVRGGKGPPVLEGEAEVDRSHLY